MTTRRIDHLVFAVHDLEKAAGFYESLGFRVGARNRHPWGTENRLVQFRSSFLELVTLGEDPSLIPPHTERSFSFGAYMRDWMEAREGLAMMVLDSSDARGDAAAYAAAGIGDFDPFFFERKGRKPDGSETHVAFTLAFAVDKALPEAGFFVCEQHFPEAFWNAALQEHANGASDVTGVTLGVAEPERHLDFFSAFTGVAGGEDQSFALAQGGCIRLAVAEPQGFTAFRVAVPDLAAQAARLEGLGIPFAKTADLLSVPAEQAFGVAIEFVAA